MTVPASQNLDSVKSPTSTALSHFSSGYLQVPLHCYDTVGWATGRASSP